MADSHRSEFVHGKQFPVSSDPSLLEYHRTTGHLDADQNTNYNQNRKQEN